MEKVISKMDHTMAHDRIIAFTSSYSNNNYMIKNDNAILKYPCAVITTYSMMTHQGTRGALAQRMLEDITEQNWGLLLSDEVHTVPATVCNVQNQGPLSIGVDRQIGP